MKRILLASASLVAFAGVAAADHVNEDTADGISLSGSATIGYNDEIENGFFVEGDLGFTLARELNNGLLAAVTFGLDIEDTDEDNFSNVDSDIGDDFVISLTDRSGSNGIHFGDTSFAAERHWFGTTDASGLSIPDAYLGAMAADAFSEQDGETAIRGDTTFGTFNTSVSYVVADADGDGVDEDGDGGDLDQLSVGTSGVVGGFTFNLAYQEESEAFNQAVGETDPDGDGPLAPVPNSDPDEEDNSTTGLFDTDDDDDFSTDEVFGVSVGSTFAGADVRLAYATNRTEDIQSLGVSGAVPVGPVGVEAYYTIESSGAEDDPLTTDVDESDPDDSFGVAVSYTADQFSVTVGYEDEQGDDDTFIDASFDATEELTVFAGYSRDEEGYVAAEYDLGNGASLLASFAETDEAGPADYKEGTTIALSLGF